MTDGGQAARRSAGWRNVTVSEVAVAAVTVPTAAPLNATVLFDGVVALKPKPLIVSVVALAARSAVLLVTTGVTVATCTAVPLSRDRS